MKAFEEKFGICPTQNSPQFKIYLQKWAVWKAALEWAENQFIGKSSFQAEEAINKELRSNSKMQ